MSLRIVIARAGLKRPRWGCSVMRYVSVLECSVMPVVPSRKLGYGALGFKRARIVVGDILAFASFLHPPPRPPILLHLCSKFHVTFRSIWTFHLSLPTLTSPNHPALNQSIGMLPFLRPTTRLLRPLPLLRTRPPLPSKSRLIHTTPRPSPGKSPKSGASNNNPLGGHSSSSSPPSTPGLSGLDIYGDLPNPVNSIEALYDTHFLLTSGIRTAPGSGVFLLNDSVFTWAPDAACKDGVVGFGEGAWGVLEVVWPKPGLSPPPPPPFSPFPRAIFLWRVG